MSFWNRFILIQVIPMFKEFIACLQSEVQRCLFHIILKNEMLALCNCFEMDRQHVWQLEMRKLFNGCPGGRIKEGEKKHRLWKNVLSRKGGQTTSSQIENCYHRYCIAVMSKRDLESEISHFFLLFSWSI